MNRLCCTLIVWCACTALTNISNADVLFESGTLGPTEIARSEVTGGSNVSPVVFVGARFQLDQPAFTTHVGGHFVNNTGSQESFFGAIVALANENDFPDSGNLATPDVVGTTLLAFPETSAEVYGNLSLSLNPGWYALLFGSGRFGSTGSGVALNNGMDIANPSYIGWQPGAGWLNLTTLSPVFANFRFVVEGRSVPEPGAFVLVLLALLPPICLKTRYRR